MTRDLCRRDGGRHCNDVNVYRHCEPAKQSSEMKHMKQQRFGTVNIFFHFFLFDTDDKYLQRFGMLFFWIASQARNDGSRYRNDGGRYRSDESRYRNDAGLAPP